MKKKNTPTEEDALLFDAYVSKWQQLLNLQDWRIERNNSPAKGAMASVEFNLPARLAIYKLGDFGSEAITPESLEQTCIHECLHIVLFDLINVVSDKSSDDEIEAAEHRVINVFEKLLKVIA